MNKRTIWIIIVSLSLLFCGCATMQSRQDCIIDSATLGGAIGAGTGAVVGHQGDHDNRLEGGLVGAAAGAVAGGLIGYFMCPQEVEAVPDSDNDGVMDPADKCPDTPQGVSVDADGCPPDADGDGVYDYKDKCPGTPQGVSVGSDGCPPDSDGDGVYDYKDKCPGTPRGVSVGSRGCPLDSDGDGVYDYKDSCPDTPRGASVNEKGCWVLRNLRFDINKSDIKTDMHPVLDEAVTVLRKNRDLQIEIQGHTDHTGSAQYNMNLSEQRARSVMQYFIKKGISPDRLSAKGFGETQPLASNDTARGRAINRRVQLEPVD